ncbi:TPA: recombinase XerC [Streptococcus suis]
MVKHGKLAFKGADILKKQYQEREKSRDSIKAGQSGRMARYDTVSSMNSLKQHQSQWTQFAKYAQDQHGVKTLKGLTENVVAEYIKAEKAKGMAEKTLKARITAINHVMVGSGVWNVQQALSLKDMRKEGRISSEKGATSVYKDLTAKEWRDRNKGLYEQNKGVVDVARAFGLRRAEIYGKDGGRYNGLTYRNLGVIEGTNQMVAEVIGKGGKYRVATVREDMREQMWREHGDKARVYDRNYFKLSQEEREVRLLSAGSRKGEQIFKTENKKIPLHINRSEYVQEKLKERQSFWEGRKNVGVLTEEKIREKSVGFSRLHFKYDPISERTNIFRITYSDGRRSIQTVSPFSVVKIGTWQGYAIAATDVMREVGHNRLDVLSKYM